jgi:hypothetical protein
VLSEAMAREMMDIAPHVASWLSGSIGRIDPAKEREATDLARERRLRELGEKAGMTNEDVVERAQSGELEPDPEYAEWLVLLGRGDLLEHG